MDYTLKITVCVALIAVMCTVGVSASQEKPEKKVTQTAGVDNTRMGAYRALAQLSFQAFEQGDNATAAELARVLERTWDQGEWKNSSDGSFCKKNRSVCEPIDRALDTFIGPVMDYSEKVPNPATVRAAFKDFLEKLATAD